MSNVNSLYIFLCILLPYWQTSVILIYINIQVQRYIAVKLNKPDTKAHISDDSTDLSYYE